MKKFLSLFGAMLIAVSLTACGTNTISQNDIDDFEESFESFLEEVEESQISFFENTTSDEKEIDEDSSEKSIDISSEPIKSSSPSKNVLGADFKKAMDSYEEFIDEYISFMKKYSKNPTDFSLLADYSNYMNKYTKVMEDFEEWEDEDLNSAETAYYIEVQTRVSKKLLEVAQ